MYTGQKVVTIWFTFHDFPGLQNLIFKFHDFQDLCAPSLTAYLSHCLLQCLMLLDSCLCDNQTQLTNYHFHLLA